MGREVTDGDIQAYLPLVENEARRWSAIFAESDDLIQEGMIAVWQTLVRGNIVTPEVIQQRMTDYVRWNNRDSDIPYELAMPIERY